MCHVPLAQTSARDWQEQSVVSLASDNSPSLPTPLLQSSTWRFLRSQTARLRSCLVSDCTPLLVSSTRRPRRFAGQGDVDADCCSLSWKPRTAEGVGSVAGGYKRYSCPVLAGPDFSSCCLTFGRAFNAATVVISGLLSVSAEQDLILCSASGNSITAPDGVEP